MRMQCEFMFLMLTNIAISISEPMLGDEEKRLYNFGLGKRAYSYVSEYKRLPVYSFGLGKRFEGKNIYSFGLGKRDENEEPENRILYPSTANKRGKNYNFGLGKRLSSANYDIGLDKKAKPQYSFGLGKRLGYYNFGLGKRQNKYSFGLGKRDKAYSFGLGKRYPDLLSNEEDALEYEDGLEEEKQKENYSLNVGKRYITAEDMDEQRNQSQQDDKDLHYEVDFDKSNINIELPIKSISQTETKISRQESKKYEQ